MLTDDWRADGYRWRQGGSKPATHGDARISKKYFRAYTGPVQWTSKFMRVAYFHCEHPKAVLVTYVGDDAVAAQFAHGNSRQHQRPYVRTQPSVLRQLQQPTDSSARQVYQQLVLAGPSDVQEQLTSVPRNIEQVRNSAKATRNRVRLSRDALYNLHEFAYDSSFVHHITTYPDLLVIRYDATTLQIFTDVVANSQETQLLSYDTTFTLGDFYLSILLFRQTEFDSNPVIPLAYLLHERKTQAAHTLFWQHMRAACKAILAPNVVIVTDNERAITHTLEQVVPEVQHLLCRNHIIQVNKNTYIFKFADGRERRGKAVSLGCRKQIIHGHLQ